MGMHLSMLPHEIKNTGKIRQGSPNMVIIANADQCHSLLSGHKNDDKNLGTMTLRRRPTLPNNRMAIGMMIMVMMIKWGIVTGDDDNDDHGDDDNEE